MRSSLHALLRSKLLWDIGSYSGLLLGIAFLFFQGWSLEKFEFVFLAILLFGICSFAFFLLVARRILKPLKAIQAAAEQVSQGDLSARAPAMRDDEIGDLAESFNTMVAQLSQAQERFSKAFHANAAAMSIVRVSDAVFLEVNDSWLLRSGYSRDEVIGHDVTEVAMGDDHAQRELLREQLREKGRIANFELRTRAKDGTVLYGLLGAELIEIDGVSCLLSSVQDITERVNAEQALRASEERFSKIFHSSPSPMCLARLSDHILLDVNEQWLRKFKLTREVVIGRNGDELKIWRSSEERTRKLAALLAEGRLRDEEIEGRASDGTELIGLVSAEIMELEGEACALYTMQDITARKHAEDALRLSEERFSKAFHAGATPRVIIRVKDRRVIEVNEAALTVSKQARSDVVGLKPEETSVFVDTDTRKRLWHTVLTEGVVHEEELTYQNGLVALTSGVLLELAGEPCVLWEIHNISDRKRAEAALKDREEWLGLSLQAARLGAWELDVKAMRVRCSTECEALFGFAPGEYNGTLKAIFALIHPEDRSAVQQSFNKCLLGQSESSVEYRVNKGDGAVCWHSSVGRMLYDEGGNALRLIGVITDITERKLAEDALRERETRLRLSMQAAGLGAWDYDIVNRQVKLSPQIEKLYGLTDGAFQGAPDSLRRIIYPEDMPNLEQSIQQLTPEHPQFSVEFRIQRPNGELRWQLSSGRMFFDSNGKPERLLGVGMDIHERKKAETILQESRTQLRQLAARLQTAREAERAEIARNIHDDLGQSMTGMRFLLKWLEKQLTPEQTEARAKVKEMLELIGTTIVQIRRVATSLRPGLLDDFGLVAALQWQAQEFSQRTGIGCRLNTKTSSEEMTALAADRATAFFRIFQEALTNVARHAEANLVETRLRIKGDELVMTILDDGRGVAPDALTNARSLGLLGMRERAEMLGGTFRIAAVSPRGTLVTVRMPMSVVQET